MSCSASCSGFSSLRDECVRNPCYADNLCQIADPSITDCAAWCCESRGSLVFFAILFFCIGVFFLAASHYVKRLHEANVQSGAANQDGSKPSVKEEEPSKPRRLRATMTSNGVVLSSS